MLFAESGGMFEAQRFARAWEVSRPTIANYLSVALSLYAGGLLIALYLPPRLPGFEWFLPLYIGRPPFRQCRSGFSRDRTRPGNHTLGLELARAARQPYIWGRFRFGTVMEVIVATLTLKYVPDELYKRLKESAEAHRRSLNQEAIRRLSVSLGSEPLDVESFLAEVKEFQGRVRLPPLTDEFIDKAKGEGRP